MGLRCPHADEGSLSNALSAVKARRDTGKVSGMNNIALVGFMGCGKTTIGRELASSLNCTFVDTDEAIEKEVGLPVPDIFAQRGEPFFRRVETEILARLSNNPNLILSCGGGIVKEPENIRLLKAGGRVVYLRATPRELTRRIRAEPGTRPLIYGERDVMNHKEVLSRVQELLAERAHLYEAAADHIVDTTRRLPREIAEEILRLGR